MSKSDVDEQVLELADPILDELYEKKRALDAELARYVAGILQEFWRSYPQLDRVDELSLSLESMQNWLAARVKGG